MNWIDYTIFVILFFSAILGLVSGPILQFFRISSLFISFFTAFFFHGILRKILDGIFSPSTGNLLSYFIIFGAAFIITYIFIDIVKRLTGTWKMGFGFRLLGASLGIIKGIVFCGIIIFGILLFCSKPTQDKVNNSKIAAHIGKGMHTVVSVIPESILNRTTGFTQGVKEKSLSKETKPAKDKETKSAEDEDFRSE
jgi:uncharacterized membrane protein required for colicin V production